MAKVLIVDDELDILESVEMLVQTLGHETETTTDGNKAVSLLKKGAYDLVLLDILMPKISGIKTLEKIRADPKLKNQKVAFLTVVSPSKTGAEEIKKLNPIDYMEKPIDNAVFKKKIQKILK